MEKQAITSRLTISEKKKIKSLHTKKGRNKTRLFVAEGIRLLEEAYKFKYQPRKLFYTSYKLSSRAKKLLENFQGLSIPTQAISVKDMNQISEAETSQGLLALFDIPEYPIDRLFRDGGYILLLDNISDPGNAGTLIRSAAAFGFDTVLLLQNSVDPFNPKVVRSTVGAIFGVKVKTVKIADITNAGKKYKTPLIAADAAGDKMENGIKKIKTKNKFIFAVGSERTGLSPGLKKLITISLRIEHLNNVESLNAAVAGSIIMHRLYKDKRIKVVP